MGCGAICGSLDLPSDDQDTQLFDKQSFNPKLISIHHTNSIKRSSNQPIRPALISYIQLSTLEKSSLRDIATEEESDQLFKLIRDECIKSYYSDEKLYFEIGEWDSHEIIIHVLISLKKHTNLQKLLKEVVQKHPDHYKLLVNIPTSDGLTPVMYAIATNSIQCLHVLLNAGGIDLSLQDHKQMTAFSHAKKEKQIEMLDMLNKYNESCKLINMQYIQSTPLIEPKLLKRRDSIDNPTKIIDVIPQEMIDRFPKNFTNPDHSAQMVKIKQSKKFFCDNQFQATAATLCDPKDTEAVQAPFLSNIVWLRPYQIFNGKDYKLFEDNTSPEDVIQGKPKTCFYLAVFASLALHPKKIRQMIRNEINPYGYYIIQLYINGKRQDVIIDDQFPCMDSNRKAAFCQPNGAEIWVMLLEKAWIKTFGFYSRVQCILPEDIIEDLLGVPSYGYTIPVKTEKAEISHLPNFDAIFNRIRDALNQSEIVVAVSSKDIEHQGISPCQSYSVLEAAQIGNVRLLKIRNSITNVEWDGEYGDTSINLTPQIKEALNYESKKDGIFWMTIKQFCDIFVYYSIGYCKENFFYTFMEFQQPDKKENNSIYFRFTLSRKQLVNLRLIQPFSKYMHERNYQESPAIFNTLKIDKSGNSPKLIAVGCPRALTGHKSIHFDHKIFKELDAGDYIIHISVKWRPSTIAELRRAVVGIYCEQQYLRLIRMETLEGDEYLKNAYFQWATIKGKRKITIHSGPLIEYSFKDSRSIIAVDSNHEGKTHIEFNPSDFENCIVDIGRVEGSPYVMNIPYRSVGTIEKKDPTKPMHYTII